MKYQPFNEGRFYHIYNRGNNKEKIFLLEDNYKYFLRLVKKHILPIAEVYSYCLLSNHFHFVIRIREYENLPQKFQSGELQLYQPFSNLFNAYAKAFNKQNNRSGSLFQEHLKRIELSTEEYLRNLIIYVNTNSSHHGMANFKEYEYSSYRSVLSLKPTKLVRDEVLLLFSGLDNFKYVHEVKGLEIENTQELLLE